MIVAYCFIGKLPSYIVDTIKQLRLFYNDNIYLIIDDITSDYIKLLIDYDVKIIDYNDVKDLDFESLITQNKRKFQINFGLKDRKLLFIKSFERFYVLNNLLKKYNLSDCLFLELDNMIYDNPNKWFDIFKNQKICMMYDNKKRISSGLCFIKNSIELEKLLQEYNHFISSSTEFMNEMTANWYFYEKNNTYMLPIIWKNHYNKLAWENSLDFPNNIFDASSLGIYLCGYDIIHTGGKLKLYENNRFSEIDYTKYKIYWKKTSDNLRKPFIKDDNNNEYLINNLHIHSKELHLGSSLND